MNERAAAETCKRGHVARTAGGKCVECKRLDDLRRRNPEEYQAEVEDADNVELPTVIAMRCRVCDAEFRVHRANFHGNHFCSSRCYGAWRSRTTDVTVACAYCGKALVRKRSHVRNRRNIFCSKDHWRAWQAENNIGRAETRRRELDRAYARYHSDPEYRAEQRRRSREYARRRYGYKTQRVT